MPERGEQLLRVLQVGIDGTDRELDSGEYGAAPAGESELVIGHESLAQVVDSNELAAGFDAGELVVATVRRPCPPFCLNCRNGQPDFCLTGEYTERGIKGAHGFLAQAYCERPEFLVRVPPELRQVGVLVEPLSIVEKAFGQISSIQRRTVWRPHRVLITGAGSIGVLAAILARLRGLDTLVYSLGELQGVREELFGELGIQYVDARKLPLEDAARQLGAPDIAIEATGHSPLAWQVAGSLARNGVACLLSVTGGEGEATIPSDELNNRMVLGNRLVFGAVNAQRQDFEEAIEDLIAIEERWPGLLDRFITRRLRMESIREALAGNDPSDLKTVIELGEGNGD